MKYESGMEMSYYIANIELNRIITIMGFHETVKLSQILLDTRYLKTLQHREKWEGEVTESANTSAKTKTFTQLESQNQ